MDARTKTLTAEPAAPGRSGATMRAAVVTGPRRCEILEVPVPEPGPGQVRIRLEGCGVCASNVTPWLGPDWMQFPTEAGGLGHEGWGIVDAAGPDTDFDLVGQRVATLSQHSYAEYDVADAQAVVTLPAALADRPFPGEPLGCAMNILRRSAIRKGETVAVVGIGFLGALLVELAAGTGARVIALSRRPRSLDLARARGAAAVVAMDEHWRVIERVKDLTGGRFCDCVIETAGKQWPLDLAAELTAERGRLVVAGYHQDGPRQVNMQLWNWRGLDVINAHERALPVYAEGVRAAVEAVLAGRLDPTDLFTHRFGLDELGTALDLAHERPEGFVKALITF